VLISTIPKLAFFTQFFFSAEEKKNPVVSQDATGLSDEMEVCFGLAKTDKVNFQLVGSGARAGFGGPAGA